MTESKSTPKITQGTVVLIRFITAFPSRPFFLSITSDRWRTHSSLLNESGLTGGAPQRGNKVLICHIDFLESTAGDVEESKLDVKESKDVVPDPDGSQQCGTLPQRSSLEKICATCGSRLLVTINLDNLDSADSKKWLRHNCPQCRKVLSQRQKIDRTSNYFTQLFFRLHFKDMQPDYIRS